MKLTLRTTTITVLTLLPYLAPAITPINTTDNDVLDGYVGYLSSPPTGDWLTATYCYCAQPYWLRAPHVDEGAVFQWDYYNYHRNRTYVMHRLCRRNHDELETCVNNRAAHCVPERDGNCEANTLCSYWGRKKKNPAAVLLGSSRDDDDDSLPSSSASSAAETTDDRWCMSLDDHNLFHVIMGTGDNISWNGQSRKLSKKGGQGRKEQPDTAVWPVCEAFCRTRAGMRMLRKDKHGRSHQEVFEDLDDMCDDCR